ncbi:MAG: hypothetical protein HDR20_07330, partial [Lachnospiraceae bacterium]|nr:hypothetical protein [Lachnospiraceae bacterium]
MEAEEAQGSSDVTVIENVPQAGVPEADPAPDDSDQDIQELETLNPTEAETSDDPSSDAPTDDMQNPSSDELSSTLSEGGSNADTEFNASLRSDSNGINGKGLDELVAVINTNSLGENDIFDVILTTEAEGVSSNKELEHSGNDYKINGLKNNAGELTFSNLDGKEFTLRAEGENAAFTYTAGTVEGTTGRVSLDAKSTIEGEGTSEEDTIITGDICINDTASYTVTVTNHESNTATSRDKEFNFKLNFDYAKGHAPTVSNPVAYFDIPEYLTNLKTSEGTSGIMYDNNTGKSIGRYEISGNRIIFTYDNKEWLQEHNSEMSGYFEFSANIKTDYSQNKDKVVISFGGNSEPIEVEFENGKV